jgi:hypothetical protein
MCFCRGPARCAHAELASFLRKDKNWSHTKTIQRRFYVRKNSLFIK